MRITPTLAAIALLGMAGHTAAAEKQHVTLDHGISFTLPEGWARLRTLDNRQGERGRLVMDLACETERCKKDTLETCSVTLFPKYFDENTDRQSFDALYADPMDRYSRMRAARIATSKDAEFRRELAPVSTGARDWWVTETDARNNMKSGLFADTIIAGWQVRVSCKTCETSDIRHRDAMNMLATFHQFDD